MIEPFENGESLPFVEDVLRCLREFLLPLDYSLNGQLGKGEETRVRQSVSIFNTNPI